MRSWKRTRGKALASADRAAPSLDEILAAADAEHVIDLDLEATRPDAPLPRDPLAEPLGRSTTIDRATQYVEWAQRMHDKRQRVRESLRADVADRGEPTYWSTEALFADSKRVQEHEDSNRPDPARVRELLAVLHLSDDADPRQVADAYRQLAKQHHPDRFLSADEATRRLHADKMREVNHAYQALKQLQRA
jgi:hypothetical protein